VARCRLPDYGVRWFSVRSARASVTLSGTTETMSDGRRSMRREGLCAVVAGTLLTTGLMVGVAPVPLSNGQDCGSPFSPRQVADLPQVNAGASASAEETDGSSGFGDAAAECRYKQDNARTGAIALTVLGGFGLAALVAYLAAVRREASPPDTPARGN
jgi:hypothetical protein